MFQDGETRVINGTTYVRQGGVWNPQSGATPIVGPPKQPAPQTEAQAAQDALQVSKLQSDLANVPIEREAKQVDIAVKQKQLAEPSDTQVKLAGRLAGLDLLEQQINQLEGLYAKNFKGSGLGAAVEYLPGQIRPENAEFDNAGRALMGAIAQAQGLTAQQQNTPTEMEIRFGPFIPKASDRDGVIEFKIQQLRQLLAGQKNEIGAQQEIMGSTAQRQVLRDEGQTLQPATTVRQVDDPSLTGLKGEYLRRLESGQSATELFAWMKQAGVPMTPAIMQSVVEQIKFHRANPNVPVSQYNIEAFDDRFVPTSGFQQTMTDAAQSPLGAAAMAAGNAVTGNNLDSIVGMTGGNAEQARIALNDAAAQNPTASLIGGLSGGVTAALGAEAALGGAGMAPGFMRALAADSGYGAVSGAGSADGSNRASGALEGALFGAGGSIAGQGVARGAANAISPSGGNLTRLYETGVRPTPGQRFANSGVAGKTLNLAEEGLSSVPVVGGAIRGAREEARDQFQIGAFNEALKEIGLKLPKGMGPGTKPHAFAQQAFDAAYNKARSGLVVRGDNQMVEEVQALKGQIENLAGPSAKRFESILQNVVMRRISKDGGELSGESYKNVQKEIGRIVRGIRKSKSGDDELGDALEELQGIIDNGARRHSSPEAVKALDDADRGYAKFVRIMDAAKSLGGEPGVFTPAQFNRSVQRNARGRRSEEYLRGEALMQDYAEQGMNLVDRLPNSGSADRAMLGLGVAGGAGAVEPSSLAILGALGLAYAPGARKVLKGSMAPRPGAKELSDSVRKRARIAGASGAVLGTSHDQ